VNIVIKNFPHIYTEQDIKKLFKKYGSVKRVVKHKTKQEAIVTMPFQPQAQEAIYKLDGSKVLGRTVSVKRA
jgi:RNA recognition motif-containing protein